MISVEVKARCCCSTSGCDATLEYWATLDVVEKETYSYDPEPKVTTEISISRPPLTSECWTEVGYGFTSSYYCEECSEERLEHKKRGK